MRSRDNNPVKWTSAIYSMKIDGKMTIMGNTNYMWKILRLPIEFFTQRMSGDIVSRQKTNASITSTIQYHRSAFTEHHHDVRVPMGHIRRCYDRFLLDRKNGIGLLFAVNNRRKSLYNC